MLCAVALLFAVNKAEDKMERYVNAAAVWTFYCFIITEVLSVFQAISIMSLWICWLIFDLVLLTMFYRIVKKDPRGLKELIPVGSVSRKSVLYGLFILVVLCLAVKTKTYNWDSMTYHLPRLFHWLQNGTVDHYATHISRQVASPILGAFVNLHVYAMTGRNDVFINMLQCCSFLTSGILVYHIAKKIGCSQNYSYIAGVLFYSMPIAFAESFTAQVDNFAGFWMLCFTYLLLNFLNVDEKIVLNKKTVFRIVILSICLIFGYLTKPSVGFGMLFMLLWLLIIVVKRRDNFLLLAAYFFLAGGIMACILAPDFFRNWSTFHAMASPGTGQRQLIGSVHWRYIIVNFVKNFTFNMPAVWLYNSSTIIWKYVMRFSRIIEVDIDDPVISEDGREFQVRDPQDYGNSTAVNPIIVWLLIICIFLFVLCNFRKHLKEIKNQYFITAALSFMCFCAVLRWEPFVSRYMISYLAVLCPAIAGQLELFFGCMKIRTDELEKKFSAILYFLCIAELLGMLYYHGNIAINQSENNGYFVSRREIQESYIALAEMLNQQKYQNIGLLMGSDSYEYPLTTMLQDYSRIEHVNVSNQTEQYEDTSFIPDVLIAINYDSSDCVVCHGYEYERAQAFGEEISVFLRR